MSQLADAGHGALNDPLNEPKNGVRHGVDGAAGGAIYPTPDGPQGHLHKFVGNYFWGKAFVASFLAYLASALPALLLNPALLASPAAGVAFVAGYLGGVAGAAGIFFATLASSLPWSPHAGLEQLAPGQSLLFAMGNGLGAWAASTLLKRSLDNSDPFAAPREAVRFCLWGAGSFALITSSLAALPFGRGEISMDFVDLFFRDYVGVLIISPPLLLWILHRGSPLVFPYMREGAVLCALTLATLLVLFGPIELSIEPAFRLAIPLLIPLFWAASRLEMRFSTTLTLLCFLLVLATTSMGYGIFRRELQTLQALTRAHFLFAPLGIVLLVTGSMAAVRRKAEEKLRGTLQSTQQLIHSASVMILGMDSHGMLKLFNRKAGQVTGFTHEELAGADWVERICPPRPDSCTYPFQEYRSRGKLPATFETPITTKAGRHRLISWQANPIEPSEESITMICFGIDITERRQAEEELKKTNEQIHDLYEEAPCGYHSFDRHGVVLRMNETELKRLGYDRSEVLGKNIRQFISPQTLPRFEQTFAQLLKTGAANYMEIEFLRKDGGAIPIAFSSSAVRDANGEFLMSRSTTFDITERRMADFQLRQTRNFLNLIVDNIPNMVFVKESATLKFLQFNKAGEKLLGLDREELLGKSDYDLFPRQEADFFTSKDREVLASGELVDIPEEQIHTNAGVRTLHTKKLPIHDEQGRTLYLMGISEDITDLRRVERQLDRFFNLSVDLFCIASFDGYFRRINPEWTRVLGYSIEELMGKPFIEFVHPEDHEATRQAVRRLASGKEVTSFENRYRCKNGAYRWLVWQARAVIEEDAIYAAAHDCTERKEREETLRNLAENLRRSNEELEQFAYVASHDLQEPLRMVGSYTRLLGERYKGKLDADADRYINFAVTGSQRMQALIQDLLAFSRVGTRHAPFQQVAMETVLAHVLESLEPTIHDTHATLTHSPLPEIRGEPSQLEQLLLNLLSNALKFHSDEPPRIHIAATQIKSEWLFSIQDNGIGIAPEYFDRIFAIFQRLHSRERYEGTGIGLAVCKKIVERHGGRIWVESIPRSDSSPPARNTPDQPGIHSGSTFYFTLPVRPIQD